MKLTKSIAVLLGFSLLLNVFLIREIVYYEPALSKSRFANRLKQRGLINDKVPLSMALGDSTMTMLALGQSNAGNYVNHLHTPKNAVYNYYDRQLFTASDPLIGADGNGGSVWTVLADMVIEQRLYKKVVIISLAIGGSTVECWAHGTCRQRLEKTLADMEQDGLAATHIFWHQGESDAEYPPQLYKQDLNTIVALLKNRHQPAPFYCAIASYSPTHINTATGVNPAIADAQKEFISNRQGVYQGANTDSLIQAIDRYDGQHFSEIGNLRHARLWLDAIMQKRKE